MTDHLSELLRRHEALYTVKEAICQAFGTLKDCFSQGGTLFVCGNGGSAADAEHIVGELMKGFLLPRRQRGSLHDQLEGLFGEEGKKIALGLQGGLRAVSLNGHPSLATAFANDVDADLVFAQQLSVLAKPGDVLLGLTTSGNSRNVLKALRVAKAMGVKSVAMTGAKGGECVKLADCAIKVPETETFLVQELHLPVYHALCAMLEEHFFHVDGVAR